MSVDNSSSSESDFIFDEDFSLCNDNSKLQPYSFEPLASSSENEEEESAFPNDEIKRVGNLDWCLCKCCKQMESEHESLCCQETNEISEILFEGVILLNYM